jgi:hypothetical protein
MLTTTTFARSPAFLEIDVPLGSSRLTGRLLFLLREQQHRDVSGRERYAISAVPLGKTSSFQGVPVFRPCPNFSPVEFRAEADPGQRTVKFGGGYVVIDPEELRGLGLGSYLFSRLIEWAQREMADFEVCPMHLPAGPADKGVQRRERFYKNFGFTIRYDDPRRPAGVVEAATVGQLTPHWSSSRVRPLSPAELSRKLGEESHSTEVALMNLRDQLRASQARYTRLRWFSTAMTASAALLTLGLLM